MTLTIELDAALEKGLTEHASASKHSPQEEAVLALRERFVRNPAYDPERAKVAVERILAARNAPDAPHLNLPEGMSIREYMHEGH